MPVSLIGEPKLSRNLVKAGPVVLAVLGALLLPPAAPAGAVAGAQPQLVSATPSSSTPDVNNGHVEEITQVGSRIILGGNFTSVSPSGTTTVISRSRILAFDAATGTIDAGFHPSLDDQVNALLPGPAADTVYVGGLFKTIDGVASNKLVLLSTVDGHRIATFAPPPFNSFVGDVKSFAGRLYVGGGFTKVGGVAHAGLVTLNATSGALDPFMNLQIAGHHSTNPAGAQAPVAVNKLDISPNGQRMMAIGNFKTVNSLNYDQAVMVDLAGGSASIADWQTNSFVPQCNTKSHDSYLRDVNFSPDGTYFAIVATGGPDGRRSLCDSASRWESTATGSGLTPTWVDWTGGDTLLSVAVTDAAVYVGGHQRWLNNPYGGGVAGPGAVPRPGIAALDPVNGLPLSWNPGRNPRGAGTYALFVAPASPGPAGLYVGSDTSNIGVHPDNYTRARIVFFPLAGGKAIPSQPTGSLPGNVYQLGLPPVTHPRANVLYRVNAGGPLLQSLDTGPNWSADTAFVNTGSRALAYPGGVTTFAGTPAVPATTPVAIFDTERSDPAGGNEMQWAFTVPATAKLTVRLYFANRCTCTKLTGQRAFNVAIDGNTVDAGYDIVKAVGDQTGTMKQYAVAPSATGSLSISFTHGVGDPIVDGIEVLNADSTRGPADMVAGGDAATTRAFTGTTSGAPQLAGTLAPAAWHHARGAFMVGSSLFYGWDDSTLRTRAYNGSTFGDESLLDPYHDPIWNDVQTGSGQTYTAFVPSLYNEMDNVTGMFYAQGRIYYTLFGQSQLFNRYFSPESGVAGAEEFAGAGGGINWSKTAGLFLDATGHTLYYSRLMPGDLMKVGWSDQAAVPAPGPAPQGVPVGGNPVGAAASANTSADWRSRGVFVGP